MFPHVTEEGAEDQRGWCKDTHREALATTNCVQAVTRPIARMGKPRAREGW